MYLSVVAPLSHGRPPNLGWSRGIRDREVAADEMKIGTLYEARSDRGPQPAILFTESQRAREFRPFRRL